MRNDKLRALRTCNRVGRVLTVINKFLTGESFSDIDKEILKDGLKFLQLAQKGRMFSKNFQLSESITEPEASSTYGVVLRATDRLIEEHDIQQKDIDGVFDQYVSTISEIISEQTHEDPERIVVLRDLFEIIEDTCLKTSLSDVEDILKVEDYSSQRKELETD